ncbi:MAG: Holliday junction branch migration protein RuvA [Ezakiella sp.]|nr:Holliday junction branch migration protein RuvA [Ezakiella sp.]MDD7471942.1 Holliday junction branch migration protein RuvA [Bacillota bacterium]
MYDFFRGKIVDYYQGNLIIEVMGIGYKLEVGEKLEDKFKIGEEKTIYTELVVSENKISIYGFFSKDEKKMFNLLRTVPKVGPKTASGILGGTDLSVLVANIINQDKSALSRLPGIGTKTAERIIIDLKDKVMEFNIDADELLNSRGEVKNSRTKSEVVEALIGLGYSSYEIEKKLSDFDFTDMSLDEALRYAIKNMN